MILIRAKLLHLAFTSRIINNEVPPANTQFWQMRVRGCGDVRWNARKREWMSTQISNQNDAFNAIICRDENFTLISKKEC